MMTNADKIRAMTDEELEAWLKKALNGGYEWFEAWACNRCHAENGGRCPKTDDERCSGWDRELLEWLKAPAEN